jgi:hypothetical protein
MAQPNAPVNKTGYIPPARLIRGIWGMQGDHTLATIGFVLYVTFVERDHVVVTWSSHAT